MEKNLVVRASRLASLQTLAFTVPVLVAITHAFQDQKILMYCWIGGLVLLLVGYYFIARKTKEVPSVKRPDTTDYRSIFLNDAPLMDVRAPVEFEKGAFPRSVSRPLMLNEERHLVGICYKENGKESAIKLGGDLVSGKIKEMRMKGWATFAREHAHDGYLYCFRGGLRSRTIQLWIRHETGIHLPLVTGGYKAMRHFLLEELDRSLDSNVTKVIRVCGPTGSSKTKLLAHIPNKSIDLEGLAHHRGSSFGQWPEDPNQPSQIDFEISLSISLLQLVHHNATTAAAQSKSPGKCTLFLEDEGSRIGKIYLPKILNDRMATSAGLVIIEENLDDRIEAILQDYIYNLGERYGKLYGTEIGMEKHRSHLVDALGMCKRRMSKECFNEINNLLKLGFDKYAEDTGDVSVLQEYIKRILADYYDPLYPLEDTRQPDAKVLFRGNLKAAIDFCKSY